MSLEQIKKIFENEQLLHRVGIALQDAKSPAGFGEIKVSDCVEIAAELKAARQIIGKELGWADPNGKLFAAAQNVYEEIARNSDLVGHLTITEYAHRFGLPIDRQFAADYVKMGLDQIKNKLSTSL